MKLHEITNIKSSGDATTLSGGKLPNVYRDNVDSVSKLPRTKKKDMYGSTGMKTSVDNSGDGDVGDAGAPAASPSGGAAPAGGDGGGGAGSGAGSGGAGSGGGA